MKKTTIVRAIISLVLICIVSFIAFQAFSNKKNAPLPPPDPQYLLDERSNIVGTWISQTDPDFKWVIDNSGFCHAYYNNDLIATYFWEITNTTPRCGEDIYVNESEETSTLMFTDMNSGNANCYVINGVTDVLSLSPVGSGSLVLFNKQ